MKTLMIKRFRWDAELLKMVLFFAGLTIAWPLGQGLLQGLDLTAGYVDSGIWMLVILALICFVGILVLSWWLLQRFWMIMGLPALSSLVLGFNELQVWMQLGFYYLCYALVLLAGVACLIAVL